MTRTPERPHAEIHHEEDGWHADLLDWDPVRGLIVISTVVITFAAALAWVARMRRLVGS